VVSDLFNCMHMNETAFVINVIKLIINKAGGHKAHNGCTRLTGRHKAHSGCLRPHKEYNKYDSGGHKARREAQGFWGTRPQKENNNLYM
jgi:hypothetical protein